MNLEKEENNLAQSLNMMSYVNDRDTTRFITADLDQINTV